MPSRALGTKQVVGLAFAILAASGCSGAAHEGSTGNSEAGASGTGATVASTSNGGTSTGGGSSGGASTSGAGTTTGLGELSNGLHFDAGASSFGPASIGSGTGEGELFFAELISDGGYVYYLQHLTPLGIASQGLVTLATGTPTAVPKVAVASDGAEVTCCWEDWGGLASSVTKGQLVRCNTVASRGKAPDLALQGGFSDIGSKPSLSAGPALTALAYAES